MRYLKLLTRDFSAMLSATFVAAMAATIVVAHFTLGDLAAKEDFSRSLRPPSLDSGLEGLLGTDTLGRSNAARLLEGGFASLTIAVSAGLIAATIGSLVGLIAGYRGGILDSIAMRVADVVLSFPMLLLALVFLYMLDPRPVNIVALLVIGRISVYVRVVRAETVEIKSRLFVDVARCRGASGARICRTELAPIALPTVVTLLALDLGLLILIESGLSYLGMGVQAPSVSWGSMVADGREYIATAWWLSFFPGLVIFLFALSANMLSNWARIATDPAQRWRLERGGGSAFHLAEPKQLSMANAIAKSETRDGVTS